MSGRTSRPFWQPESMPVEPTRMYHGNVIPYQPAVKVDASSPLNYALIQGSGVDMHEIIERQEVHQ